MKTKTFINLSTATANVGVLLGLVFLIFELRQNSAIALSQIRQERTLSIISQATSDARDTAFNELKLRLNLNGDFDSITMEEWNQIRDYELARSVRHEDVFFQYKRGLIDNSAFRFSLQMAASRLSLWKWLNIGDPNPEFAAAINVFIHEDGFKQSNFAAVFNEWAADKESPNSGLGSAKVFE